MFWGGKSKKAEKASKGSTQPTRKRSRGSKKSKGSKSGRKLNEYFTLMLDAKKNNLKEFKYNGKTYKQVKTKTGLVCYKRK